MKVSVVITTYNQEAYIEKALLSVIEQEYDGDIEILVGDDCSTDNTRNIIMKLTDLYPNIIKPMYNERNAGLSQNLYNQIVRCTGGVIAYLDGDDWWIDKNKLKKQVSILKNNSDYGLVISYAKSYNQTTSKYGKRLGNKDICDFKTLMFADEDVQSQTMLFRSDILFKYLDHFSWYVENNCFFDSIITYYFAYYSKIFFIEEELAVYRVLTESGCHTKDKNKQREYTKRYYAIKTRFLIDNNIPSDISHKVMLNEWDKVFNYASWAKEIDIRDSKTYKIGNFFLTLVKKIRKILKH